MTTDSVPVKMPMLFVGHGSPMNALEDNPFSRTWRALADTAAASQDVIGRADGRTLFAAVVHFGIAGINRFGELLQRNRYIGVNVDAGRADWVGVFRGA